MTDSDIRRAEQDIYDPQWCRRSSSAAREVVYRWGREVKAAEKRRRKREAFRRGERPQSGCVTALAWLVIILGGLMAISVSLALLIA